MAQLVVNCDTQETTTEPDEVYPLDQSKAAVWEAVKGIRDQLEMSDEAAAPTSWGPVQCNDKSKIKINGLVSMAQIATANGQPFAEEFTLADNTVAVLTGPEMIGLGVAVGQYVSAIHARARDLRNAIEFAADHAELEAIDITVGWP